MGFSICAEILRLSFTKCNTSNLSQNLLLSYPPTESTSSTLLAYPHGFDQTIDEQQGSFWTVLLPIPLCNSTMQTIDVQYWLDLLYSITIDPRHSCFPDYYTPCVWCDWCWAENVLHLYSSLSESFWLRDHK